MIFNKVNKGLRIWFFIVYVGLLTTLSLLPSSDLPSVKLFPYADKLIHLCMYAGFTFLMMWSWPRFFKGTQQLIPLFAVMFYGLGMEILQDLGHQGRSFEIMDVVANTIGYLPGWLAYRLFS